MGQKSDSNFKYVVKAPYSVSDLAFHNTWLPAEYILYLLVYNPLIIYIKYRYDIDTIYSIYSTLYVLYVIYIVY